MFSTRSFHCKFLLGDFFHKEVKCSVVDLITSNKFSDVMSEQFFMFD